ncbi:hypothetical protein J6590_039868 [Homalodisca vitripennis]|nr:hypothetical protein J6590_039868 [Homalodisca vitripennis]
MDAGATVAIGSIKMSARSQLIRELTDRTEERRPCTCARSETGPYPGGFIAGLSVRSIGTSERLFSEIVKVPVCARATSRIDPRVADPTRSSACDSARPHPKTRAAFVWSCRRKLPNACISWVGRTYTRAPEGFRRRLLHVPTSACLVRCPKSRHCVLSDKEVHLSVADDQHHEQKDSGSMGILDSEAALINGVVTSSILPQLVVKFEKNLFPSERQIRRFVLLQQNIGLHYNYFGKRLLHVTWNRENLLSLNLSYKKYRTPKRLFVSASDPYDQIFLNRPHQNSFMVMPLPSPTMYLNYRL